MKKKNLILCVIGVMLVILVSIWLFVHSRTLGNMNHSYAQPTTNNSEFSFSGKEGEKLRIIFTSDVKSGDLDILLYDSNGNVVYELDKAKELCTFYTLENTDTYTLSAECNQFVGDFKILIYSVK